MKRLIMPIRAVGFMCLFSALTDAQTINDYVTDLGLTEFYAQTAWPAGHRDSRNSTYVPLITSTGLKATAGWTALDGAGVLAGITIGPEGNVYATTGKEPGINNLHAFNREGHLLWTSHLPDSGSIASSPVLDVNGNLYLSDSDQLWAFRANGALKWVAPMTSGLVTAIFTVHGFVGGVTTDGGVVLFNRDTGALVSNNFALPPGTPLPGPTPPAGIWQGLVDPAIVPFLYAGLFGFGNQVVNTAAINPINNRLFITAAGPLVNGVPTGRLYGIDVTAAGQLSLAFTGVMGPGSGSSPSIAPDGSTVYASDGVGNLFAFDARTSAASAPPLWVVPIGDSPVAPSVGPDGTIYTLGAGKAVSVSSSGVKQWERSFDAQAQALPLLNDAVVPRKGRANSGISISPKHLYVTANLGYQLTLSTGNAFVIPARSALFILDPNTGAIVAPAVSLRDVNEGILTMAGDGSIYITHGATATSVAVNAVIPSLPAGTPQELQLKAALTKLALRPTGGISALQPLSILALVRGGIQWGKELGNASLTQLATTNPAEIEKAYSQVRQAIAQLDATLGSIADAASAGEIDSLKAQDAQKDVEDAQAFLNNAEKHIAQVRSNPNNGQLVSAMQLVTLALARLDQALAVLN